MDVESAKGKLQRERKAHWTNITNKEEKRRVQNQVNKCVSRWRQKFHLITAEDYHLLISELQDMREGNTKTREGRPRRYRASGSKRRTSQRLTHKRQKSDTESSYDEDTSPVDFSEETIIVEDHTSQSPVTSQSSNSEHGVSNKTSTRSDSIPINPFDSCDSHTYSNIPLLFGESWHCSDDYDNLTALSGMFCSKEDHTGDSGIESFQQDVFSNSQMENNHAIINRPHTPPENEKDSHGSNNFPSESHQTTVEPSIHDSLQPVSGGHNEEVETWASKALPLPPEESDDRIQQEKRFDGTHLCVLMEVMKNQLKNERENNGIQGKFVSDTQPPLARRDSLATLVKNLIWVLDKKKGSKNLVNG
ncbi:hypothetical protein QC760_010625 [Botrytis cinerea]